MTSAKDQGGRRRGSVRERGGSLQVRVFAGQDLVTGRDRYLSPTVKGTDRAAQRQAAKVLTQLQAEVDRQRTPQASIPLRQAVDEWLRTTEIEDTTRRTYVGDIERTITPALGSIAIDKLSARTLETLYAELRRCRARCDGRRFVERHRVDGEHDCADASCVAHVCKPMAASTVRQVHSIIRSVVGRHGARQPQIGRRDELSSPRSTTWHCRGVSRGLSPSR